MGSWWRLAAASQAGGALEGVGRCRALAEVDEKRGSSRRAASGGARAPSEEDERGGGEMGIEEMGFGREDAGGAREDAREGEMAKAARVRSGAGWA